MQYKFNICSILLVLLFYTCGTNKDQIPDIKHRFNQNTDDYYEVMRFSEELFAQFGDSLRSYRFSDKSIELKFSIRINEFGRTFANRSEEMDLFKMESKYGIKKDNAIRIIEIAKRDKFKAITFSFRNEFTIHFDDLVSLSYVCASCVEAKEILEKYEVLKLTQIGKHNWIYRLDDKWYLRSNISRHI